MVFPIELPGGLVYDFRTNSECSERPLQTKFWSKMGGDGGGRDKKSTSHDLEKKVQRKSGVILDGIYDFVAHF